MCANPPHLAGAIPDDVSGRYLHWAEGWRIAGAQWEDFDFDSLNLRVVRAVVRGIGDRCKTETSEGELPLDETLAAALLEWKNQCPPSAEGWLFPSPRTGRPYELNFQQKVLRPAGDKMGIPNLGFHTFRHTYRAWLDSTGASVGVQQRLMRHAQSSTTMNTYGGDGLVEAKRQANSDAVRMLLQSNLVFVGVEPTSNAVALAS